MLDSVYDAYRLVPGKKDEPAPADEVTLALPEGHPGHPPARVAGGRSSWGASPIWPAVRLRARREPDLRGHRCLPPGLGDPRTWSARRCTSSRTRAGATSPSAPKARRRSCAPSCSTAAPPLKAWYAAPMFRYEQPQAGRFRQHHQLGVEILGTNDAIRRRGHRPARRLLRGSRPSLAAPAGELARRRRRARPPIASSWPPISGPRRGALRRAPLRMVVNPLRVLDCKKAECRRRAKGRRGSADRLCEDCRLHFAEVLGGLDGSPSPMSRTTSWSGASTTTRGRPSSTARHHRQRRRWGRPL